jgi:hypothetical protein
VIVNNVAGTRAEYDHWIVSSTRDVRMRSPYASYPDGNDGLAGSDWRDTQARLLVPLGHYRSAQCF